MRSTIQTLAAAALLAAGATASNAQVTFYLTVLHASDGESQIVNAGPGALVDYGGIARFKTKLDRLRAEALVYPVAPQEKGGITINAGDTFLAGPEFNASLELAPPAAFYDSIGISLLNFDACIVGNHEFDFNPEVFQRFLEGFSVPTPYLSANLNYAAEPGLQALVGSRLFKSKVITVTTDTGTEEIGVIGATTTDLPFISTPRGVTVSAVAAAVNAEVIALQNQGVNKIILASHLQGITSEAALIPQLSGVDLVIGAGGGELIADADDLLIPGDTRFATNIGGLDYPRVLTDFNGKQVPLVATRGDYRYIGRLIVGFNAAGEIVSFNDPNDGPVRVSGVAPDAVASDPTMQALVVNPVAASVAALAANVIAQSQVPLDGVTNNVRAFETNLGNLATDSILYNAIIEAPNFGAPIADVALQNGGGMRNNSVIPAGNFTELNTFEVLPFSNFISVVPNVPPAQFKEILENAVSRVAGTTGGGSGTGRFAQIAGFRFVWNSNGVGQQLNASNQVTTPGTRVREVILNDGRVIVSNGQVVPGAPSINVATIDFLARGGDQYPFRGLPFTNLGVSYQQSLERFVVDYTNGLISSLQYPVGGERRIVRLNTPLLQAWCAADHDLNGSTDADDIFAFLNDWFATLGGAGAADADGSGVTDADDLFTFLGLWFAGCGG